MSASTRPIHPGGVDLATLVTSMQMNEHIPRAQLEAANAYESLMVPSLFRRWASRVTDAARIGPAQRVLDIACGTGVLARTVAERTGRAAAVSGVDAAPGMLAVATRLAPELDWRQGVAESLPFGDQSFDAVLSQFGLMFFTDRRQAIREAARVLVPGGRLTFAVWDRLETMPAFAAEVRLLEEIAGSRAADPLRAPFVLGDRAELAALFEDSGLDSVQVTTDRSPASFPGIRVMVEADVRGWLPLMGVVLPEEQIAGILDEAEQILRPYVNGNGRMVFETSAHIVTGTRSHAPQV